MKTNNYLAYFIILLVILFRGVLVNLIINFDKMMLPKNDNLQIKILKEENTKLISNYKSLLNFKNNIKLKDNYIITNIYKSNYTFDKLLINGTNYQINDEVITDEGLIGTISNIYDKYSEISYLGKEKMPVIINDNEGKITGLDKDNNLIVNEVSNYNKININDKVYSIYGTYIGKVIKKEYLEIDTKLTIKKVSLNDLNYVAVISRYYDN
jgi:hypothetical protein